MSDTRSCSEVMKEIGHLLTVMNSDAPPLAPSDRSLSKLVAVVTELSKVKNVQPVKCPPDYIALWDKVSSLGTGELSARAIRYLSWETGIAILPAFQTLALSADKVSARSLQGLVRSVHRRWDSTVNTPAVANLVHSIARYEGRNPLIEMWKQGLQHVLNQNGPKNFAGSMLRNGKTWDQYANEWGVEADTEFGNRVLEQCVTLSILRAGSNSGASVSAAISLALPCRHWKNASFKSSVEQMISWCSRSAPHHADQIKSFILDDFRLLDPRLPGNMPNWAGVSEGTRDLVIQWLSAEDIQLFSTMSCLNATIRMDESHSGLSTSQRSDARDRFSPPTMKRDGWQTLLLRVRGISDRWSSTVIQVRFYWTLAMLSSSNSVRLAMPSIFTSRKMYLV